LDNSKIYPNLYPKPYPNLYPKPNPYPNLYPKLRKKVSWSYSKDHFARFINYKSHMFHVMMKRRTWCKRKWRRCSQRSEAVKYYRLAEAAKFFNRAFFILKQVCWLLISFHSGFRSACRSSEILSTCRSRIFICTE